MERGRLVLNKVVLLAIGALALLTAKGPCPFRDGVTKVRKNPPSGLVGCFNYSILISGTDSLVMAAWDGEVEGVFNVGDVKALMIHAKSFYYTYSELDSCLLTKGQRVRAGDVIGYSLQKEIDFIVSDEKGRNFEHPEKCLECTCKIIQ
jgi:hypothetical protein